MSLLKKSFHTYLSCIKTKSSYKTSKKTFFFSAENQLGAERVNIAYSLWWGTKTVTIYHGRQCKMFHVKTKFNDPLTGGAIGARCASVRSPR